MNTFKLNWAGCLLTCAAMGATSICSASSGDHLGLFLGATSSKYTLSGTNDTERDTDFTGGLNIERLFTDTIGAGADLNHTPNGQQSNRGFTTGVVQAFYHLNENLKFGLGPGFRKVHDGGDDHLLGRLSAAYTKEFGNGFGFGPAAFVDYVDSEFDYGLGLRLVKMFGGNHDKPMDKASMVHEEMSGDHKMNMAIEYGEEQEGVVADEEERQNQAK